MAINSNSLVIPLDGTGVEIPTLSVNDSFNSYIFINTVVATGNYAIVATGTPQLNTTFRFENQAVLDITTHGTTFSIFGQSITQSQLNTLFIAECIYNGSAWKVTLLRNSTGETVETANIKALAVTTAKINTGAVTATELGANAVTTVKVLNNNITLPKLAQIADLTVLGNISGGTANVSAISLSSITPYYAWSITGNSGLIAGTNFIGTTDNVDLIFKRNNVVSGGIDTTKASTYFGLGATVTAVGNLYTAFGTSAAYGATGSQITAIGFNSALSSTGSHIVCLGYYSAVNAANSYITNIGENTSSIGDYGISLGYGAVSIGAQFAIPTNITTVEFGQAAITTGTTIGKRLVTAANSTATLTAAQVKVGYITTTSAAATVLTLPTGALLGTALGASQGTIFDLYFDNTAGANILTIAVSVGGVLNALAVANGASAGLLTIPAGATGQGCFRLVFSSASAFTFSRVS